MRVDLLYIHRSYFAQAIRQDSENPLRHIYAPSVLATYRSACRLISALRDVYALHPQFTGEVWFFWSGIYSACVRRSLYTDKRQKQPDYLRLFLVPLSSKALDAPLREMPFKNWI
jgi:hypothetical protein